MRPICIRVRSVRERVRPVRERRLLTVICQASGESVILRSPLGAMAQLVARFHGMEEVRGSNPLSSTSFSHIKLLQFRRLKSLQVCRRF